MAELRHLSLFAGCGGIDLGFKWAGIDPVAAVEIKQYACDTLKKNHPGIKVMGPPDSDGDVRNFNGAIFKDVMGFDDIDIISGGPPCQPFSVAASQRFYKEDERYKRKGDQDAEKGDLLTEYIRIVNELRPKVFVIENVAAMISWNEGRFLEGSLKALDGCYVYSKPCAVHAHLFGVPQYRERMMIIGTRVEGKKPMFNDQTVSLDRIFTVGDALEEFPDAPTCHQLRKHTPGSIERYSRLKFGERDKIGRVDRLDPNKPSKTVIAGGENGGGRSHLHPYMPRTTSPRECARFQTFPDDFEFCGNMSRQFTQVGNAVPPLLAYFVASYIKKYIFDMEVDPEADLCEIKHPVVRQVPKHIIGFNAIGEEQCEQISLF